MAELLLRRLVTVFSVVCVLAMAFFPQPHGSFQATHGPVTAFRARWSFMALIFSVMTALLRAFTFLDPATMLDAHEIRRIRQDRLQQLVLTPQPDVMRC
jgi:hypothetical protein